MKKFIGCLIYCIGLLLFAIDTIIWAFQYDLGILAIGVMLMFIGRLIFDYDEDEE